jgi:hypothetical protein
VEIKQFKREHLHPNPRVMIFGKTGSGKSIFVRWLLSKYNSNFRIIVIDTKKEKTYADIPILKVEDFAFKTFIRRVSGIKMPDRKEISDTGKVLEVMAGLLLNFQHTILVIEELPSIVGKHDSLYNTWPNTAKTLLQGRATYNGIITIAQSPSDTNLAFIKQSDDLYAFRCQPIEEDTLSKITGVRIPFESIPQYHNKESGNDYGGCYSQRHNCIFDIVPLPGKAGRPPSPQSKIEKTTGELTKPEVSENVQTKKD